ncbi:MAG: Asp-tRNA(Asn)/Glu-tRNA(Gln) amidotransferase subunit GatB [Chloroflexi bacterium]|nr:Asp-tRNA(Asn)/Glu-tRNA(Gln) amidotransferase subunit GatB [Chloroflexota bacterium]
MTTYETVIGLEVHAQLLTKSKMFCGCSIDYTGSPPNTGLPGVLPVINKTAVEYVIMTALALNCSIPEYAKFDRKNYPYPDLMKGYQISQFDQPLSLKGWLDINVDGKLSRLGITRVHLEEDTAKLLHRLGADGETYSLVDVNRGGVPLMEIVGEPEIRSAEEARQYLITLRTILQYLNVSTGNMEDGSFRCDANISIRPVSSKEFMTKVEIKNMNSFKAVYSALEYESKRQREVVEEGGRIVQETRGWNDEMGITVSQRSKEFAHDYRYFPEPDLPPMEVSRKWVEEIKARLPELPDARCKRFIDQYSLSSYDSQLLTVSKPWADYFENSLKIAGNQKAKTIANWMTGELARLLNTANIDIAQCKIKPGELAVMLELIDKGVLSTTLAKSVFDEMFNTGKKAAEIVSEKDLAQISGSDELSILIERVIKENSKAVADYMTGKEQSFKFIIGQVMKASKGRANPVVINTLVKERLNKV